MAIRVVRLMIKAESAPIYTELSPVIIKRSVFVRVSLMFAEAGFNILKELKNVGFDQKQGQVDYGW